MSWKLIRTAINFLHTLIVRKIALSVMELMEAGPWEYLRMQT